MLYPIVLLLNYIPPCLQNLDFFLDKAFCCGSGGNGADGGSDGGANGIGMDNGDDGGDDVGIDDGGDVGSDRCWDC